MAKLIRNELSRALFKEDCADCNQPIMPDERLVVIYRVNTGPRKGFTLRLHPVCAKDLGADLMLEIARV